MPYTEVMHKWKKGELHSGSKEGPIVKSQPQAVAIMLSEKREAEKGKKEYQAHAKGGVVCASGEKPFKTNIVETAVNPTGAKAFSKGGAVEGDSNPPAGRGWRRWGVGT